MDPRTKCVLVNNVWNKAAAGRGFEQAIFAAEAEGTPFFGWRWRTPWQFIPQVVSQPQIVCGDKPWDEPLGMQPDFPFRVGAKHLTVSFDVKIRAAGMYNMAFSLWAVSSLPASRDHISHEIMIWNANNGQPAGGQSAGLAEIGGGSYLVSIDRNHGDISGKDSHHWTYVAFVRREPLLAGSLEMSAFLSYLLDRGLLSKDHLITSLEFGNEVCEGVGIVELRELSLAFR